MGSDRGAGTVLEVLPNCLYLVELEDGRRLSAHLSGKMRMNVVRLIAGDAVVVEVSAFDRNKARVVALGDGRPQCSTEER